MTTTIEYKTPATGSEAPKENPADAINQEQGNTSANKTTEGDRPAWLPDNYKTPEDFAKSFTDTKAELTRVQQELAKFKKGGEEKPEGDKAKDTPPEDKIREAAEEAGIDNAPYQKEFDETGDLSQEGREKAAKEYGPLIKKMFGDDADALDVVNRWVDGQKASIHNYRSEVAKTAGGEEQYNSLLAWASGNYSDADKAIFNKAVNSGDLNAARQAVDGLMARFTKANGNEPNLIGGENTASTTSGYKSAHEMQQAISDPRYEKDPVYRKSVEQRIGKSNF